MSIQWFPGHMHSTRQAIARRLPDIDVVVELLDARLPGSSASPLLAELAAGKPALKILNKQDLADPQVTASWLAHYQLAELATAGTTARAAPLPTAPGQAARQALALDASAPAPARQLVAACRALAPQRGGMVKPLRVLVCGIPNVGKSTLINTLHGQRVVKTGDEPGITRQEQMILLASDFQLFDTPGLLWPRLTVEQGGWHLAASGAIGRNAYDEQEVALALLARVRTRYAERLRERYRLDDFAAASDEDLLTAIGRKRGGLTAGGQVRLHKAAEIVLNDFRSGAWGRITLETPPEFSQWAAAGAALEAERQLRAGRRRSKSPLAPLDEQALSQAPAAAVDDSAG